MSAAEIVAVQSGHTSSLGRFFEKLDELGVNRQFHPHPLSAAHARHIAQMDSSDYYCVMLQGDAVIGYGMLRGWDEGFETPSLGLVIDPEHQKKGLGGSMLEHLCGIAAARGASRVRLKVHPDNISAIRLYRRSGFELTDKKEDEQWVAYKTLDKGHRR